MVLPLLFLFPKTDILNIFWQRIDSIRNDEGMSDEWTMNMISRFSFIYFTVVKKTRIRIKLVAFIPGILWCRQTMRDVEQKKQAYQLNLIKSWLSIYEYGRYEQVYKYTHTIINHLRVICVSDKMIGKITIVHLSKGKYKL